VGGRCASRVRRYRRRGGLLEKGKRTISNEAKIRSGRRNEYGEKIPARVPRKRGGGGGRGEVFLHSALENDRHRKPNIMDAIGAVLK